MIVFLLVAAALLVSGCCGCCSWLSSDNSVLGQADAPTIDDKLLGTWSNGVSGGDVVDQYGYYVNDEYSGESYTFNQDGTFTCAMASTGTLINGLITESGKYKVSDGELSLYDIKESFTPWRGETRQPYTDQPAKDRTYTYSFEDDRKTLVITEDGSSYADRLQYSDVTVT